MSGAEKQRACYCANPEPAVTQANIEEEEPKNGLFGNRRKNDGKNNKADDTRRTMRVLEKFDNILFMRCVSKFRNETSGEIRHEDHRDGAECDGRQ